MKTTIIGPGLIGGSIAIDLRKTGLATKLLGVESNPANAKKALELGLVDEIVSLDEAVNKSDVVITAIPVNVIKSVLLKVIDLI
jgi:prephenate dehydrogenase